MEPFKGLKDRTHHLGEVTKIYVAVFQEQFGEVIYSGIYYDEDGGMYARATVETDASAVGSLIEFCKTIEEQTGLTWRLLLFDENGIQELSDDVISMYVYEGIYETSN